MDKNTRSPDRGEEDKPDRNIAADQLVQQQHQVFPDNEAVELALAVLALAKNVRNLFETIGDGGRREQIEQDLEALPGEAPDGALEGGPGKHKEPAHRIAEIGGDDQP